MLTIPEEEKKFVLELFNRSLLDAVRVVVFTRENNCPKCQDAVDLVNETAQLTDKIEVFIFDINKDKDALGELQIDLLPAVMVATDERGSIFYYGVPSGYVYKALVDDIIRVSRHATQLTDEGKRRIKQASKPVHIRVLATLNCPLCPHALGLVHQLALENPNISTDFINIDEFPDVGRRYNVLIIPKIVINEKVQLMGASAISESTLIDRVFQAVE